MCLIGFEKDFFIVVWIFMVVVVMEMKYCVGFFVLFIDVDGMKWGLKVVFIFVVSMVDLWVVFIIG